MYKYPVHQLRSWTGWFRRCLSLSILIPALTQLPALSRSQVDQHSTCPWFFFLRHLFGPFDGEKTIRVKPMFFFFFQYREKVVVCVILESDKNTSIWKFLYMSGVSTVTSHAQFLDYVCFDYILAGYHTLAKINYE